jgi:N-acyl homoserine lactone hydrolase
MKLNDKISGIDLDIVVTGFPGKSVCHGGLGWSTVVVLRAHGRIAVVDTGGFSMRTMLLKRFAERGLNPKDVTDLLLTHSHHDHSVNYPMFPNARIVIGAHELDWSLTVPWGETPVPEFSRTTRSFSPPRKATRCSPASRPIWRRAIRRVAWSMCCIRRKRT